MALIKCPDCSKDISDAAPTCPNCGRPMKEASALQNVSSQPPDSASEEDLRICVNCQRPNWKDAKKCYSCGEVLDEPGKSVSFPDIRHKLPDSVKRRLLSEERAFAYVYPVKSEGCGGSSTIADLLVTDSRTVMKVDEFGGCSDKKITNTKMVDVPINHISSVEIVEEKSGCGGAAKGLTIRSGTASLGTVRSKKIKELEGAMHIAQKMQKTVLELKIEHSQSPINRYLTLSIGVSSTIPNHIDSAVDLVATADKALYEAKNQGRNCIVLKSFESGL